MTQNPDSPKAVFKWDGTVNVPILVTAGSVLLGAVMWANSLSGQVSQSASALLDIKTSVKELTTEVSGLKTQNAINAEVKSQVKELEQRVRVLEASR